MKHYPSVKQRIHWAPIGQAGGIFRGDSTQRVSDQGKRLNTVRQALGRIMSVLTRITIGPDGRYDVPNQGIFKVAYLVTEFTDHLDNMAALADLKYLLAKSDREVLQNNIRAGAAIREKIKRYKNWSTIPPELQDEVINYFTHERETAQKLASVLQKLERATRD